MKMYEAQKDAASKFRTADLQSTQCRCRTKTLGSGPLKRVYGIQDNGDPGFEMLKTGRFQRVCFFKILKRIDRRDKMFGLYVQNIRASYRRRRIG